MNAETMYTTLAQLHIGDPIPASVYMLDYRDGTVPPWTIEERAELGAGGVKLVVRDASGPLPIRLMVLTFPAKTLRTRPYVEVVPGMLCDLMQQHRKFFAKRNI